MAIEWIGRGTIVAVMAWAVGFVGQSLLSGRIDCKGRQCVSRSTNPIVFVLWLVLAVCWCGLVICLALPLAFP